MGTKYFIRAVKRSCYSFLAWTCSRWSRYVSVCILSFCELADVKQLTETLRSEAKLFWCQIVRNAKIFSSSQYAAPGEVTGFLCYYLALASNEPALIWCNFTVFLWSGRGEGGLRIMLLHCQDCKSVSILLPSHVCFWQVQILKGAESYWF